MSNLFCSAQVHENDFSDHCTDWTLFLAILRSKCGQGLLLFLSLIAAMISLTLAMAKAVRAAGFQDTRITNSHCDLVKDEDLTLFGKYNVIANTTCAWHYDNPDMDKIIGDRRNKVFRMRSMIDGGARMGQGSDFPIDEYGREPLKGIEMGCTRRLCDHPELPSLKPHGEKLSVEDGILSYTINNAYQMRRETEFGSIKPGKLADLVILEENLFDIPVERIHRVRVCETIMHGQTRSVIARNRLMKE